jgi:hypothetical protein
MKTAKWLASKVPRTVTLVPTIGNTVDPKFFNQVAQFAHFGMMFFVMMICSLVGQKIFHHWWSGMLIGGLVVLAYGVWHEFFWDPVHENQATSGGREGDLEDFFWLEAGGCIAAWVYFFLVLGG